jgi:hypothetical protein
MILMRPLVFFISTLAELSQPIASAVLEPLSGVLHLTGDLHCSNHRPGLCSWVVFIS